MNKNYIKKLISVSVCSIALAVFLGACNVKPDTSGSVPTQTVAEREAVLKAFLPWRALGAIAIDSETEGKYNASFAWDVNARGFEIKLFGPLGVQLVHLQQNKKGARITDRNGTIQGQNAEALLADILGTQVPIKQMQNWAVGLPGDAIELQRDDFGRLEQMVVTGEDDTRWNIEFKRYSVFEEMHLPKTVVVASDGVKIDLSFKKWSRAEAVDNGRLSIPGVGT